MIIDPHLPQTGPDAPVPTTAEALPDYTSALQSANPPRYSTLGASPPSQPVTYTFTPWTPSNPSSSSSSFPSEGYLLLIPRPFTHNLRQQPEPLYRISACINLNPFLPISYITQVHRPGPWDAETPGELVGKFELSLNQKRAILTFGDTTTRLSNVLSSVNGSSRHWTWTFNSINLRWDCRTNIDDGSPMCICYSHPTDHQLASFVPPSPEASPPLPPAVLTVFPRGHADDLFDHIVASALIVERKMTAAM
ncbi:hypothetical protein D9615_006841 [Tricholomella constricta]|uniref:DUF6593 domain-containing protein n=1 Tax=Tricholomella constricta TaxID=117010 RepID=A0A8H5H9A0_9AGAR|nr:hypothetical protein D9615_006841 [Tricholomella constricta]